MKQLLFFLLLLLGACEPALESSQFGDYDQMARRENENKPVHRVNELPPVAVVQPSNGWWTGSNNLGYEVKFAPDSTNRQTVLKLDEFGVPEIWTVSLAMRDEFSTFNSLRIRAIIEFGAGGTTQTVTMDWAQGAQISLPMNALNVIAQVVGVSTFATEGPGLHLGVQISKGRRGGSIPPRLTVAFDDTVSTGVAPSQVDYVIPAFAQEIIVLPANEAAFAGFANVRVEEWSGLPAGFGSVVAVLRGSDFLNGLALPVIGGSRSFRVINTAAPLVVYSAFANLDG